MNNTHIEGDEIEMDILNEAINENMLQDIETKHKNLTKLFIRIHKNSDELFIY